MRVTAITVQARNKDRVNVSVDGKYRFSLDMMQLVELGVKVGKEYTDEELTHLEQESQYGKLYTRTLEYALMRPRSKREVKDYLYRKTRDTLTKTGTVKKGVSKELTERVFERLVEKKYVDDEKFARFWVENRNVRKGSSMRKLAAELQAKGVERSTIDEVIIKGGRNDKDELRKVIEKKRRRYDDDNKLMAYLARQGFAYDDIKEVLSED